MKFKDRVGDMVTGIVQQNDSVYARGLSKDKHCCRNMSRVPVKHTDIARG